MSRKIRDEFCGLLGCSGLFFLVLGILMGPSPEDYMDIYLTFGGMGLILVGLLIGCWPDIKRYRRLRRYWRKHQG